MLTWIVSLEAFSGNPRNEFLYPLRRRVAPSTTDLETYNLSSPTYSHCRNNGSHGSSQFEAHRIRAVVLRLTCCGCPGQVAAHHQDGAVRTAAAPADNSLRWPRDRILETSNQVLGSSEVCLTFSVSPRFVSDRE